jgi:RNA polymerase sigma factor for flagellar operon FliA
VIPTARVAEEIAHVAGLWQDHARTGDRESLLAHYWSLVERTARRLGADLPPHVERADLVSYGLLGLLDAIDRYDRGRGVPFEAYAAIRIRGAVLDGLRSIDWVPRSVRGRIRELGRVEGALLTSLNRNPTEAEMAAAIGTSIAGLRALTVEAELSRIVPLDDVRRAPGSEHTGVGGRSGDSSAERPGDALDAAEERRAVASAIEGLPARDRTVIDLYYYRGLKLTEIGRLLGVTEARVCQLNSRARAALKKSLLEMER